MKTNSISNLEGDMVILLFVHHVNHIDQGNFQLFLPVHFFKNNCARKIYLDALFTAFGRVRLSWQSLVQWA